MLCCQWVSLSIFPTLAACLSQRDFTPSALVERVLARIAARGDDHVWIERVGRDELLALARRLEADGPAGKPLYGIPFAIKDNIDLAGHPTTAACPAFGYQAAQSAEIVRRLINAGALPIGKTNLDQFATGLTVHARHTARRLAYFGPSTFPVAPVPAQPWPLAPASSASPWAPTPRARAGCRRRSTI